MCGAAGTCQRRPGKRHFRSTPADSGTPDAMAGPVANSSHCSALQFWVALIRYPGVICQASSEACVMQANRSGQEQQTAEAQQPLSLAPVRPRAGPSDLTLRPPQRLTAPDPARPRPEPWRSLPVRLRAAFAGAAASEADRGLPFLFLPVAMGAGAGLFYGAERDPLLLALLCGFRLAFDHMTYLCGVRQLASPAPETFFAGAAAMEHRVCAVERVRLGAASTGTSRPRSSYRRRRAISMGRRVRLF